MMLAAICAAILVTWTVCAGCLIGIGSLALHWFGVEYSLADSFWVGLGTVVASLEIYSLIRPIHAAVALLLACVGLVGLIAARGWFFERLRALRRQTVIVFLAAFVFVALRSAGPCDHYDTGLYGASAVRWIMTYPVVPGLANLLFQLGYNSSMFLCVAALEHGPWRDQAHHLFVGFVFGGFLATAVLALLRMFSEKFASASDWFKVFLLIPAGYWAITGRFVGMNSDLPTAVVCLTGIAVVLRELEQDSHDRANADSIVAAVLLSLAVSFKLSAIVFAVLGWVVLCVRVWYSGAAGGGRVRRLAQCTVLPAFILVPWIGRNLVLSGYPLFPSSILPILVDWRVPAATLRWWSGALEAWARNHTMSTQGFGWIKPWLKHYLGHREVLVPMLFVLGGAPVTVIAFLRRQASALQRILWLLLPAAGGVAFWFLTVPDPRFGEAALWTLAGTLGASAAVFVLEGKALRARRIVLLGVMTITFLCAVVRTPWRPYMQLLAVHEFLPLPRTELVTRQTASGLTVYLPAEGDQCWDAPLPCLPYFDKTLRLRRLGQISSGFAAEGLQEVPVWRPTKLASRQGLLPE